MERHDGIETISRRRWVRRVQSPVAPDHLLEEGRTPRYQAANLEAEQEDRPARRVALGVSCAP